MSKENKELAAGKVDGLLVEGMTNMWHGIRTGITLFEDAVKSKNLPAMMVLTDGMPNHMCPPQGYVPKLKALDLPCSIHTFGFGYSIRSGLLKSIAEIGGGNYAFIADAGMIGTVFVHAVANLQSTYAMNASLTLTSTSPLELGETTGATVDHGIPAKDAPPFSSTLTISLGNLQYGQSREIFLRYNDHGLKEHSHESQMSAAVNATLTYTCTENGETSKEHVSSNINDTTSAPSEWCAYHRYRSQICEAIASIFPIRRKDGEHVTLKDASFAKEFSEARDVLKKIAESMRAANMTDEWNQSLLEDLCGEDQHGQVLLAVSDHTSFYKWGQHYLPSLLGAYARQYCNSFKDPAPLMFGRDSPLFVKCRDALDSAFDNLEPPQPSRESHGYGYVSPGGATNVPSNAPVQTEMYKAPRTRVRMAAYNNRDSTCFAGACAVRTADGSATPIERLRPGANVWTPAGSRKVAAVVQSTFAGTHLHKLGDLLVTAWHPVQTDDGAWRFPANIGDDTVPFAGSVYSLLLEPDADRAAHAVEVGGRVAVTLGHGVVESQVDDARAHRFFGDYAAVKKSLDGLRQLPDETRVSCGMARSEKTGLVDGFLAS